MICFLAVFALDGPELAVVGFSEEINPLIGGGPLEFLRDGLWHFTIKPDVLEFAGVFGIQKQVGFHQSFEEIAILLFGQVSP